MKLKEIITEIEREIAPPALAESWDSPGLKTGACAQEISKILVCLDVTSAVVAEAVQKGCNLIISHHPVIFRAVSAVTEDREPALCSAIRAGIAVYAAHTNLDYADGGVNDALAEVIGLNSVKRDETGHHRYGKISGLIPFAEFIADVKLRLEAPCLPVIVPKTCEQDLLVERVGISCGAFDGETDWLHRHQIDLLLTGELKHSDAIRLSEETFITVCAGHYYTEICGMRKLVRRLRECALQAELSEAAVPPFQFL